jgi:uncharacterized protein (UPF0332 family)
MSEIEKLREMSSSSLSDAKMVKQDSDRLFWNSLYYSLFYAAKAALQSKGIEPGTHSGTDRQLGKTFYKEKDMLTSDQTAFYSDIRRIREEMDYEPYTTVTREKDTALQKTENLVQTLLEISKEDE